MVGKSLYRMKCVDKCLLVGVGLGLLLTMIMGPTLLRRDLLRHRMYMYDEEGDEPRLQGHHRELDGPRHGPHHMRKEDFEEVDCEVEDVEESDEEVQCWQKPDGEWCAKRQPEDDSMVLKGGSLPFPGHMDRKKRHSEGGRRGGRRHDGEGPRHGGHHRDSHERSEEDEKEEEEHKELPEEEEENKDVSHVNVPVERLLGRLLEAGTEMGRRMMRNMNRNKFRCMRMRVSFRQGRRGMMRHAQAYENMTTLMNFPGCSFSRCGESEEKNMAELEQTKQQWLAHKENKVPARCFVNKQNPDQVIMMAHKVHFRKFMRSAGFHATLWPFALAGLCALIFCVRFCCCRSKTPEKVAPKSPGNPYVVSAPSQAQQEKEREAFGLPPVDGAEPNAPTKADNFLLLVPPSYAEIMTKKAVVGVPPAYVATIGEQKSATSVPPVE